MAVGVLLIAAGILKAISVADPRFRVSLAWEVAGGRQWLVALVSAIEGALGVMFAFGQWTRATGIAIIVLMSVFAGLVAAEHARAATKGREPRPCGCYGALDSGATNRGLLMSFGHSSAIIVASAMALRGKRRATAL